MLRLHCYLFLFCSTLLVAQNNNPISKKILEAKRVEGKIVIDGNLNENEWQSAVAAESFVTFQPVPGLKASEDGQIRVLFDNEGFYIGAFLADNDSGSIPKQLSQRDEIQNSDWFVVILDTYKDGNNGLGFIVSVSGVQLDVKYSVYGEDSGWDAVWESEVTFTDKGWIVEMKIPYSAIRFPKQENQEWHINSINYFSDDVGFINKVWNHENFQDIIFGIRDISIVENVLFAAYNFKPTISLTFRMRHYWANLDGLFENPQRNIISLKMIYFLDYNSIFSHNS